MNPAFHRRRPDCSRWNRCTRTRSRVYVREGPWRWSMGVEIQLPLENASRRARSSHGSSASGPAHPSHPGYPASSSELTSRVNLTQRKSRSLGSGIQQASNPGSPPPKRASSPSSARMQIHVQAAGSSASDSTTGSRSRLGSASEIASANRSASGPILAGTSSVHPSVRRSRRAASASEEDSGVIVRASRTERLKSTGQTAGREGWRISGCHCPVWRCPTR